VITDIKQYLAPLTNNERGILYAAAFGRAMTGGWVERTTRVEDDLRKYRSGRRIPDGQKDKAIMGLVEKGYATIRARRGNYIYRTGRYAHTTDGTIFFGRESAPMHKILTEKMNGSTHYRIDLWRLVEVVPVEDVQNAILKYQDDKENAHRLELVAAAQRTHLKQQELENRMLRLCEQYVTKFSQQSPITENPDLWCKYEADEILSKIKRAAKDLDDWTWERHRVEERGRAAQEQMA
jgi:hypothetical protein